MILYDQNFNFIGMSAETLAFLGYEDIDEFSSMHNDFANLFVKKEGYIHNFDNFSWIHYILYSGAPNKKALVTKKNAQEVPVDITIKEVFLNHSYEGMTKIFSVKLINENFTAISASDVHDKRSEKSTNFSLNNLTKETTPLYEEPKAPTVDTKASEITAQAKEEINPLDFKLDLPDSLASSAVVSEETPKEKEEVIENSLDFKLDLPQSFAASSDNASEETEINIPTSLLKEEPQSNADSLTENIPAFDFNLLKESEIKPDLNETLQSSRKEAKEDISEINFLDTEKIEEEPQSNADSLTENKPVFDFNLLKESEPKEETTAIHSPASLIQEEIQESVQNPQEDFALDLFALQTEHDEKTQNQPAEESKLHPDASLIRQIKEDIAEIDNTDAISGAHKEEVTPSLDMLLKKRENNKEEIPVFSMPDTANDSLSKENDTEEKSNFSLADLIKPKEKEPVQENPLEKSVLETLKAKTNIASCTDAHLDIPAESSSFSETLQNVFSDNTPQTEEKTDIDTLIASAFSLDSITQERQKDSQENQQVINKESIESSPENKSAEPVAIPLPALDGLGLSQEDIYEVMNEFLDDTSANIGMIETYEKIDDFENIKYNLIKIKSSAEILNIDVIVEIANKLNHACDTQNKAELNKEINILKKHIAAYKEHFAAISA